ncbi:Na+/H+ antiporter NhaC family protein [Streptomyces sp. NPDC057460]|uniref:Na+/H+ antiporter NhaC family protein n=1 Tax=Streptomyces sp. NPDC057460 TaxID=3346141 RepID=UPI003675AC39
MTQTPTTADAGTAPLARRPHLRGRLHLAASLAALVLSLVVGLSVTAPSLWGLLPIVLYALLALTGMNLVLATGVALFSAVLVALPSPGTGLRLLGTATVDPVTLIGLIIVLGSGVGEVLRVTGVADAIVRGILRAVGDRGRIAVMYGMMAACLVLVASLGTLAGALAIAAPLLVPVAARSGFTRSATAVIMFLGGCTGLALAPFAGSNIAILEAADTGYLTYLSVGAGPLAVLSLLLAAVIVPWVQRRSAALGDFYTPQEGAEEAAGAPAATPRSRHATLAFAVTLAAAVVYATVTRGGATFPLIALPLLAVVTGLVGGLNPWRTLRAVATGARRLLPMLLLFWMLAALFAFIDSLHPYDVVMDQFGPGLREMSPLPFALAVASLGWVGVPGATAAQVVLLSEVFGPLGNSLGIGSAAWVVILLWASKADTYGPLPNANMVGPMGLARATRLPYLLSAGWAVLIPACALYAVLLAVLL